MGSCVYLFGLLSSGLHINLLSVIKFFSFKNIKDLKGGGIECIFYARVDYGVEDLVFFVVLMLVRVVVWHFIFYFC